MMLPDLFDGDAGLYPHGIFAGTDCGWVKLLYIVPLTAELYMLQHAFALEDAQYIGADAFVFHVEDEADVVLAREAQGVFKEHEVHAGEARGHPGAKIEHLQIAVVAGPDFTGAVGEALEDAVVVEDDFAVEGTAKVDFDDVAAE